MPRNRHGVIWTRSTGMPQKMGDLVLAEQETTFTYTREWLSSGTAVPGFCLLGDSAIWGEASVSYPVSERIPVFPRLLSLIPGRNPRNLQRRHYLDLLRRQDGREPPPGIETEWRLLLLGGHGGIGHIDVFSDDLAAEHWYRHNPAPMTLEDPGAGAHSQLWRMVKREVLDENVDFDPQLIEQVLGPTPSVGGMIPKLLLSLDPGDDRSRFHPPDTPGKTNVVLKIEPPEYRGLLDLEALCLEVHRDAGFATPDWWRFDHDELRLLAVERFDRVDGRPLPMESLFSVIATGDHHFRETADIELEQFGRVLDRLAEVARLPADAAEHLYRRLLMALLTGNGDLHLENLSLLGGLDDCRWAPVYDPAPMRAWPRHDLVSAVPFDAGAYTDHGAFYIDLGSHFGLSQRRAERCVAQALDATQGYAEAVMGLSGVPAVQREQLAQIVLGERALIEKHLQV